jgi:hypothetical protein
MGAWTEPEKPQGWASWQPTNGDQSTRRRAAAAARSKGGTARARLDAPQTFHNRRGRRRGWSESFYAAYQKDVRLALLTGAAWIGAAALILFVFTRAS